MWKAGILTTRLCPLLFINVRHISGWLGRCSATGIEFVLTTRPSRPVDRGCATGVQRATTRPARQVGVALAIRFYFLPCMLFSNFFVAIRQILRYSNQKSQPYKMSRTSMFDLRASKKVSAKRLSFECKGWRTSIYGYCGDCRLVLTKFSKFIYLKR